MKKSLAAQAFEKTFRKSIKRKTNSNEKIYDSHSNLALCAFHLSLLSSSLPFVGFDNETNTHFSFLYFFGAKWSFSTQLFLVVEGRRCFMLIAQVIWIILLFFFFFRGIGTRNRLSKMTQSEEFLQLRKIEMCLSGNESDLFGRNVALEVHEWILVFEWNVS
jgi:hypothetical protein